MFSSRGLVSVVALFGVSCSKPLPPAPPRTHVTVGPPARDVGPLVALGHREDRVGPYNAPMKPDGDSDLALRVRLSGDVHALVLYSSDNAGTPVGGDVWDTLTGPDKFPPEWHLVGVAGDSWALAVLDSKNTLLNPNVALDKHEFDNETVTILVADPGNRYSASGRTYTLLVVRSGGATDRATTTLL